MLRRVTSRSSTSPLWSLCSVQSQAAEIKLHSSANVPRIPQSHVQSAQLQRSFTSSASLLKRGASRDAAPPSTPKAGVDDPSDLSNLSSAIESAIQKLKNDLSKLLPGGRFNPETLETLRVRLVKATKDTVRLGDVAQVVPRGRTVQIVVGEAAHIKAVLSSIQSSNLSLTPQPDAADPSTLNILIPPTTGENRTAAIDAAAKAGHAATEAIRDARQVQQKRMRTAEPGRKMRPDSVRKVAKEMERVVERGGVEVAKIVAEKKRVLGAV